MSWKQWSEDGYGYPLYNKTNLRKILKFIAENTEYKEIEDCESRYDAYDIMDQCCADTIAEIINRNEECTVFRGYRSDCDTNQEECIGAEPMYPWTLSEKDKTLTKEDVRKILIKYAEILGIEEEPTYFEAYYCG